MLTLCKRISREFLIIRIPDETSASVMTTFPTLQSQYSEHWNNIFKSTTTDNSFEFADLASLEELSKTLVYYTHLIFLVIKAVLKDTMNLFVYSFLNVRISMNIPSKISLILKLGLIHFRENY